jgi:hypothetical protein
MSDLYSVLAQIAIATQAKNPVRVVNLFNELGVELENCNMFMATVVDEAKTFLSDYIEKNQSSSGKPREAMN